MQLRHRVPQWSPLHRFPFRSESLSLHIYPLYIHIHPLVITPHLIMCAVVQIKSWLMCAKHSVIAKARFTHPCPR